MKSNPIRSIAWGATLMLFTASVSAFGQTGIPVVRVVKADNGYRLERDGKPFFVKGAGGDASKEVLKDAGGNSFRTWGVDNLGAQLDQAQKLGLTVTAGIWLGHKEQGFHYDDPAQVAAQFESARKAVEQYRNSPALLLWAVGNEMEGYDKGDDPAVWSAVEKIAAMIKQLDPNHPTMTVVAEVGGDKVASINKYCPDIDIVGINSYGGSPSLPTRYKAAGGIKPYIITEYGPAGTWESAKNAWGVNPELTSTEKAAAYRKTYEMAVAKQPLCLGSYAFAWGNKQEATATWFGMFLPDGSRLAVVDTMTELWSGKPVANPCPVIRSLKLTGPDQVGPDTTVKATLDAADPHGAPIKVQWILQADPLTHGVGGVTEANPPTYPAAIVQSSNSSAEVKMPGYGGGYRLFAFVRNNHEGAAVANIPLFVKGDSDAPPSPSKKAQLPLIVYDEGDHGNPSFTPAGYMGNVKAIKMDPVSTDNPHTGKTCLRVDYSANDNWGGVVWQSPVNDWGDAPGGWNLTGAKQLSFWARGAKGGETVSFKFGLIDRDKEFYDTALGALDKIVLTDKWKQYSISLKHKDLSRIKTGFCWVVGGAGQPITFYLDDIRYE